MNLKSLVGLTILLSIVCGFIWILLSYVIYIVKPTTNILETIRLYTGLSLIIFFISTYLIEAIRKYRMHKTEDRKEEDND